MSSKLKSIEEADIMVKSIKDHWPQFQVTRDNILNPTSDLAVRFYTEFITYCQEKLFLSVGSSLPLVESDADLDVEEKVFQMMSKMSNLFEKAGMTFLLGDVFEPTVVRNKHFFRICLHFMDYSDLILDDVVMLGHDITKMKEDRTRMEEQQNNLLVRITESATKKADLINTVHKLSNDLESAKKLYDECMEKNLQIERTLIDNKKHIDMLKCELQKEDYDLVVLKRQEKELEEQTITEKEHKNLLQVLDKLENEIKLLGNDDVHMTDFLTQENDVLRHYEMCNKRVPNMSCSKVDDIKHMIKLEDELYDSKLTIETLLNTKLNPTRQFVLQRIKQQEEIMKIILKSQEQLDSLHEKILKAKEDLLDEARHVKDGNARKLFSCEAKISEYNEKICKVLVMTDKMKKTFENEYLRFCNSEKQAIETFSTWLEKYGK